MKHCHVLVLFAAITLSVAGCKQQNQAPEEAAGAVATTEAPPAEPAAAPKPDALKAEQISILLALESEPRLDAAKGVIEIPVKITNNGSVALSGKSNPPVNIGVQIAGQDGGAQSEGSIRDFSRTPLPIIEPGASASVLVVVPADPRANGRKLIIDVVQEGVSWFSKLGQPTLEVGPFTTEGLPAGN